MVAVPSPGIGVPVGSTEAIEYSKAYIKQKEAEQKQAEEQASESKQYATFAKAETREEYSPELGMSPQQYARIHNLKYVRYKGNGRYSFFDPETGSYRTEGSYRLTSQLPKHRAVPESQRPTDPEGLALEAKYGVGYVRDMGDGRYSIFDPTTGTYHTEGSGREGVTSQAPDRTLFPSGLTTEQIKGIWEKRQRIPEKTETERQFKTLEDAKKSEQEASEFRKNLGLSLRETTPEEAAQIERLLRSKTSFTSEESLQKGFGLVSTFKPSFRTEDIRTSIVLSKEHQKEYAENQAQSIRLSGGTATVTNKYDFQRGYFVESDYGDVVVNGKYGYWSEQPPTGHELIYGIVPIPKPLGSKDVITKEYVEGRGYWVKSPSGKVIRDGEKGYWSFEPPSYRSQDWRYRMPTDINPVTGKGYAETDLEFQKREGYDIVSASGQIILTDKEYKEYQKSYDKYKEGFTSGKLKGDESTIVRAALIDAIGQDKYNKALNIIKTRQEQGFYEESLKLSPIERFKYGLSSVRTFETGFGGLFTEGARYGILGEYSPYKLFTKKETDEAARAFNIEIGRQSEAYKGLSAKEQAFKFFVESPLTYMIPVGVEFKLLGFAGRAALTKIATKAALRTGEKAAVKGGAITSSAKFLGQYGESIVGYTFLAQAGIYAAEPLFTSGIKKGLPETIGRGATFITSLPGAALGYRGTERIGEGVKPTYTYLTSLEEASGIKSLREVLPNMPKEPLFIPKDLKGTVFEDIGNFGKMMKSDISEGMRLNYEQFIRPISKEFTKSTRGKESLKATKDIFGEYNIYIKKETKETYKKLQEPSLESQKITIGKEEVIDPLTKILQEPSLQTEKVKKGKNFINELDKELSKEFAKPSLQTQKVTAGRTQVVEPLITELKKPSLEKSIQEQKIKAGREQIVDPMIKIFGEPSLQVKRQTEASKIGKELVDIYKEPSLQVEKQIIAKETAQIIGKEFSEAYESPTGRYKPEIKTEQVIKKPTEEKTFIKKSIENILEFEPLKARDILRYAGEETRYTLTGMKDILKQYKIVQPKITPPREVLRLTPEFSTTREKPESPVGTLLGGLFEGSEERYSKLVPIETTKLTELGKEKLALLKSAAEYVKLYNVEPKNPPGFDASRIESLKNYADATMKFLKENSKKYRIIVGGSGALDANVRGEFVKKDADFDVGSDTIVGDKLRKFLAEKYVKELKSKHPEVEFEIKEEGWEKVKQTPQEIAAGKPPHYEAGTKRYTINVGEDKITEFVPEQSKEIPELDYYRIKQPKEVKGILIEPYSNLLAYNIASITKVDRPEMFGSKVSDAAKEAKEAGTTLLKELTDKYLIDEEYAKELIDRYKFKNEDQNIDFSRAKPSRTKDYYRNEELFRKFTEELLKERNIKPEIIEKINKINRRADELKLYSGVPVENIVSSVDRTLMTIGEKAQKPVGERVGRMVGETLYGASDFVIKNIKLKEERVTPYKSEYEFKIPERYDFRGKIIKTDYYDFYKIQKPYKPIITKVPKKVIPPPTYKKPVVDNFIIPTGKIKPTGTTTEFKFAPELPPMLPPITPVPPEPPERIIVTPPPPRPPTPPVVPPEFGFKYGEDKKKKKRIVRGGFFHTYRASPIFEAPATLYTGNPVESPKQTPRKAQVKKTKANGRNIPSVSNFMLKEEKKQRKQIRKKVKKSKKEKDFWEE